MFTVRVVLAELGETDYGIYNVIGGVVVMFSFISSCMTTATQRYLTFELGRENHDRLAKVFSISLLVHIAIALAIVLLAETVGLWFVNTQMTLPASEMSAAVIFDNPACPSFSATVPAWLKTKLRLTMGLVVSVSR